MKHIRRFDEVFSGLGGLIGKGVGYLSRALPDVHIVDKLFKEDGDMGKAILKYLEDLPRTYNRSGDFDETTVNSDVHNWYYIMGKIFKNSGEKYKIDMIKHLDFKTKNVPEYTIAISKVGMTQRQHGDRLSGRGIKIRDTQGGMFQKKTYGGGSAHSEYERLDIDQGLAKNIYLEAESIWKDVHKNIKDDARGK